MTIIKISPYDNGGHDNNTIYGATPETFPVPDGWAIVPDDLERPETYPFVDITVDDSNPPVVLTMTPGIVPPPEPIPEEPTQLDRVEAQALFTALMTDTLLEV